LPAKSVGNGTMSMPDGIVACRCNVTDPARL
jgi:hypothetical protein